MAGGCSESLIKSPIVAPLCFADGTRTDWDRSKTTATKWHRWDDHLQSVFASLDHYFESGWSIQVNAQYLRVGEITNLLWFGGLPDRTTGLGMSAWPYYYRGKPRQHQINVQANGLCELFGRTPEPLSDPLKLISPSVFCKTGFTALRFCWRIRVLFTRFCCQMSKLLFKLRNVPDDEAEEVRALLSEHQIDFYETSAGNWGISLPALWVRDEAQYSQARELLDVYQAERSARVRGEYARLKQEGKHKTVLDSFRENPFAFIAYLFIVYALLYLPYKIITGLSSQ